MGAAGRGANGTVAAAHSTNDLVTLRNITKQVGFGSEIAVRGWGLYPRKTKEVQDYGFKFGIGIEPGEAYAIREFCKMILQKLYETRTNAQTQNRSDD